MNADNSSRGRNHSSLNNNHDRSSTSSRGTSNTTGNRRGSGRSNRNNGSSFSNSNIPRLTDRSATQEPSYGSRRRTTHIPSEHDSFERESLLNPQQVAWTHKISSLASQLSIDAQKLQYHKPQPVSIPQAFVFITAGSFILTVFILAVYHTESKKNHNDFPRLHSNGYTALGIFIFGLCQIVSWIGYCIDPTFSPAPPAKYTGWRSFNRLQIKNFGKFERSFNTLMAYLPENSPLKTHLNGLYNEYVKGSELGYANNLENFVHTLLEALHPYATRNH